MIKKFEYLKSAQALSMQLQPHLPLGTFVNADVKTIYGASTKMTY